MKRKDDFLRLAFGELSAEAAQAVEARANDADRVEIESFRRLHDELRHLPPAPPDGLSAERLRAAILDRELKARRPFAWGSILLAPAALAAIAAVVILPRLRPRPEVQIVALNESQHQQVAEPDFRVKNDFRPLSAAVPQPRSSIVASKAPGAKVQPSMTLASALSRSHRRARRHRVEPVAAVEEPTFNTQGLMAKIQNPPDNEISTPSSALVASAPGATGETETVVVVSSKRDLETGAPAATEKEASSVLVGG